MVAAATVGSIFFASSPGREMAMMVATWGYSSARIFWAALKSISPPAPEVSFPWRMT